MILTVEIEYLLILREYMKDIAILYNSIIDA